MKPGLLGAIINRAEAQVVRLGTLYAALMARPVRCGLIIWRRRWLFGIMPAFRALGVR